MRVPLLAALAFSLACLAPAATAHHHGCGPADGYLVDPSVQVWLEPGCTGAAVVTDAFACQDVYWGNTQGVWVIVLDDGAPCTVAGVWLP